MQNIIYLILRRLRTPLVVLVCAYAISVIGFVIIPGTDLSGQPWKMDFFHAFYFVSYMGSTIGFGELPYPFNGAQRLWTLFTIYATVIAWLFAIGTLIALVQSPLFRAAVIRSTFIRRVSKIREPFFLVCGYGDTGKLLVGALSNQGINCVVIDQEQDRIHELELDDFPTYVPALHGNAADSETLARAGLTNPHCQSVVAITHNNEVNLKVAITSKLLNPAIKVYSRAETHDTEANMNSFGTDHIVNFFDTFAESLSTALVSPSHYLLHQWLSSANGTALTDPVFPPNGRWIICGFGRFGKAIHKALLARGMPVTVIEERPDLTNPPNGSIVGRGTEADTLTDAEIGKAVGIIAGTSHDVNNLSIILTAQAMYPRLFTIARQEVSANKEIFAAAQIDLVTNHSSVVASRLLSLITTPLTVDFLELSRQQSNDWCRILISRLLGCVEDTNPHPWVISIKPDRTSAIIDRLNRGKSVLLHHLMRESRNRKRKLPCIALLLQRGEEKFLLPDEKLPILADDRILFAGDTRANRKMNHIGSSAHLLHYTITGDNRPVGTFWNWVSKHS